MPCEYRLISTHVETECGRASSKYRDANALVRRLHMVVWTDQAIEWRNAERTLHVRILLNMPKSPLSDRLYVAGVFGHTCSTCSPENITDFCSRYE